MLTLADDFTRSSPALMKGMRLGIQTTIGARALVSVLLPYEIITSCCRTWLWKLYISRHCGLGKGFVCLRVAGVWQRAYIWSSPLP